ncbi:hypothetical protein CASFOL_005159 [Castilleja foliolosa]|uniref:RRM domain-containing protein n=1 Tax=Castilleja foliolosa TaxID=1961234 RepID=A0ABD3E2P5_9LAMI
MTRSHSRKEKSGSRNIVCQDDDLLESTSARTRPFSYDDIMLRRNNKQDAAKQAPSGSEVADIALGHDNIEKTSDFPESRHKINDDSEKVSSRRKGDSNKAPKKNEELIQDKYEGPQYRDVKLKSVLEKNEANKRVREGENERRDHRNRNKDGILGIGSDDRSYKRQARDPYRNDRTSERGRVKSEIDKKQLLNDERQLDRKRRNERDLMQTERLTDRGREKPEKENRHRRHNEKDKIRNTDKKDDSGRKGSEPTRLSLKDSRAKRRRSRSRERDNRDRGRRSHSHSPKAHKRDHGEILSHSTKNILGREHSDYDKKRVSTDGSNSHNRRNVGPTSGLGGYSPRKRKTESAAKTPSPTRRSPEQKTPGWDLQPVEKDSTVASSTPPNLQPPSQNIALNVTKFPSPAPPTAVKPIVVSHLTTVSSQMHAIESVQLTQATRPMRRLYVENLPTSASEKDLIECINKSFMSYGVNYIRGTPPCISCIIHKEKSQALVEFLTPEDASSALSLDGISFSGSNLKLRRPKDFSSATTGLSDKSVAAADSVSDIVEDSPNKIFLGGISKLISSNMLLEIVRAFGPVKAFHIEFISELNEPCAFLEYVDHSVTSKACAGLNGTKLGGRVVTAVFATPEAVLENVGKLPFYGVPENAKPLLKKPTAVLKLKNVLDPEGFLSLSELELEEMLEDIKLECSRFGTVKSINVAKPTNSVGTIEACELKNTSASTDVYDSELVDRSYSQTVENNSQTVNPVGELGRSEPTETPNGLENNSQTMEGYKDFDNTDEPIAGNLMKDDKISVIVANGQNASVFELESNENIAGSLSETKADMENEPLIEEDIAKIGSCAPSEGNEKNSSNNLENADMESKPLVKENSQCEVPDAEIVNSSGVELKLEENTEEGDNKDIISVDLENVFEPGSVYVEFRRYEAACVAAHCLHGRVFDGRIVTVEYVDLDLYQTRFRK